MSRKEKREEREPMKSAIRCVFRANVMKNSNVIVQKLSFIDPYEDYSILEVKNLITDEYFLRVVSSRLPCRDYRRRCRVVHARESTACSNKAPQNVNVSTVIFTLAVYARSRI